MFHDIAALRHELQLQGFSGEQVERSRQTEGEQNFFHAAILPDGRIKLSGGREMFVKNLSETAEQFCFFCPFQPVSGHDTTAGDGFL
jgi:hypothetical protein